MVDSTVDETQVPVEPAVDAGSNIIPIFSQFYADPTLFQSWRYLNTDDTADILMKPTPRKDGNKGQVILLMLNCLYMMNSNKYKVSKQAGGMGQAFWRTGCLHDKEEN